jgi:hypothetical protein
MPAPQPDGPEIEVGGDAGGLGSPGPVSLPRVIDDVTHQAPLDVVAGRKAGTPGLFPGLERLGIVVGEEENLGPDPVLERNACRVWNSGPVRSHR